MKKRSAKEVKELMMGLDGDDLVTDMTTMYNAGYENGKGESKFEKCVLCGKETCDKVKEDIKNRACYVEGAGQLCVPCFKKIYLRSNNAVL